MNVRVNIVELKRVHVPAIAQIHCAALAGDFLPSLGPSFLRTMYDGMTELGLGFGFVAMDADQVAGFVVGTVNSRSLFKQLIARRFFQFAWQVGVALVRRPTLMARTLETFFYPSKEGDDTPPAELLVIAVDEKYRGQKIGAALVKRLDAAMRQRGVTRYKVTAFAENNGANRFYEQLGFSPASHFVMYGKAWNLYRREIP